MVKVYPKLQKNQTKYRYSNSKYYRIKISKFKKILKMTKLWICQNRDSENNNLISAKDISILKNYSYFPLIWKMITDKKQ